MILSLMFSLRERHVNALQGYETKIILRHVNRHTAIGCRKSAQHAWRLLLGAAVRDYFCCSSRVRRAEFVVNVPAPGVTVSLAPS
jgi:hypothetical protein